MKIIIRVLLNTALLLAMFDSPLVAAASETRRLDDFTAINLAMVAEVSYKAGCLPQVKIIAPEALLPLILTEVKQGQLVIKNKSDASGKIKIEACSSMLTAAVIASSGNLAIRGIKTDKINFVLAGSGQLKAAGEVDEAVVNLTGSGDLDIENLKANHLQIDLFGNGNIKAFAKDYAYVHNMGSGNIQVKGNPAQKKIERHATGEILFVP